MVKKNDPEINKRTKQALILHMIVSFILAILAIRIYTSFDTYNLKDNLTWWEILFNCVWIQIYMYDIKYFMVLLNMFIISYIMHLIEETLNGNDTGAYLYISLSIAITYNYYTIHLYFSEEYEFPSSPFEYIIGYDTDKGIGIRDGYFE